MKEENLDFPTKQTIKINDKVPDNPVEYISDIDEFNQEFAFRNKFLHKKGFYTFNELKEISLRDGFDFDPFTTRIKRGTKIGRGAVIDSFSSIEGEGVVISKNTVLKRGIISGSNIFIGEENEINGEISIDNLHTDFGNIIRGITGINSGHLKIGSKNRINNLQISNISSNPIIIGDDNELYAGLNLNIPFSNGRIWIGNNNSLGRDGGGVISSSYRFGRKWGGDVFIGSYFETTRGAEVLGFSLVGLPVTFIESHLDKNENNLMELFVNGNLRELNEIFKMLFDIEPSSLQKNADEKQKVSLFGTAKIKRCYFPGKVKVKDDTVIKCAYIRDVLIPERCKIYSSSIVPQNNNLLTIDVQDCVLKDINITQDQDWQLFTKKTETDEYPRTDAEFYQDYSWD